MKIDLRVLCVMSALLASAVLVVTLSRYVEASASRRIALKMANVSANRTERISNALELRLNPMRLQLVMPTCDASAVRDKFFIHVFANDIYGRPVAQPVNMDFAVSKEDTFLKDKNSKDQCFLEKRFSGLDVYKVEIGQFTTPGGICCTAVWSRAFSFDSGVQK